MHLLSPSSIEVFAANMGAAQSSNKEEMEHEAWKKHLEKQYDGHRHWSSGV
jgi:hypothetical protein